MDARTANDEGYNEEAAEDMTDEERQAAEEEARQEAYRNGW